MKCLTSADSSKNCNFYFLSGRVRGTERAAVYEFPRENVGRVCYIKLLALSAIIITNLVTKLVNKTSLRIQLRYLENYL